MGARFPVAFRGVMEAEAFVEAVSGVHPGGAGEDEGGASGMAGVFGTGTDEGAADALSLLFRRNGEDAQFGFIGTGDFLPDAAAGQGAGEGADRHAVLSRDEYQRLLRALGDVQDFNEVGVVCGKTARCVGAGGQAIDGVAVGGFAGGDVQGGHFVSRFRAC